MPPVAVGALVAGAATSIGIAAGVIGPIVLFETSLGIIGSGLFAAATSFALGLLSQALAPSIDTPEFSPLVAKEVKNVRQFIEPITPWKLVYGRKRVSGPIVAASTSADDNKFLHLIIVLASHELTSIDTIMLDDEPIFNEEMDAGGNVISGKFNGFARIRKHLGASDQAADGTLGNAVPAWTSNHRLRGRAYIYVRLRKNRDLYTGVPAISAWVRGKEIVELRDSALPSQWTTNMALIIYDYLNLAKDQGGAGFTAAEIDSTTFVTAANICDEIVTVKDINHAVQSVDTSNNWLVFKEDKLEIQDGDSVDVESTGSFPSPLVVSTDYFAIVERYMGKSTVQLATTFNRSMDRIPINLTTEGSGTIKLVKNGEPRYHGSGTIDTSQDVESVLDDMRTGLAGRLAHVGDTWFMYAGAYVAPTITLDETDLRGNLEINTKQPRRDRFNAVKGVYSSPLNSGVAAPYPHVLSSTYEAEDNNVRLFTDIDLPWTTRPHTAQRIAKIELERHRRQITIGYPTKISGYRLKAGDNVSIDNTRLGFTAKEFEVSEAAFGQDRDEFNQPVLVVDLLLREHDSNIYVWTSNEETPALPAPRTDLPSAFLIPDPTALAAASGTAQLFVKDDGTVVSRIKVSWTDSDSTDHVEVEFKRSADSDWSPASPAPAGIQQSFIWDVEDSVAYDIRIRAVSDTPVGVKSNYVTINGHNVIGKTEVPPGLLTFNIARLADGTRRFSWTHDPLPADVRTGGGFHIRFKLGTGHAWEDLAPLHSGVLLASPFETNELAAGTYVFGIKMIDSTNNESTSALIIEATLGDPPLKNVLLSRDERQLIWPGVIVDAFINFEGELEANGADTWADLPATWNDLDDEWKGIVANELVISYDTPELDLGVDVNFTPIVSANGFGDIVLTMATGTDADGGVPSSASFVPLVPVQDKRYIIIRAVITGDSVNFAYLKDLITLIDSEVQIEAYEDIDTSLATAGIFERIVTGHFKLATRGDTLAITSATIQAFQNAGSGWTWELLDKATFITSGGPVAAEFKIYKDGTLTDATIDAEIKGPKSG